MNTPEQKLWCEVLYVSVQDAVHGMPSLHGTPRNQRINDTKSARSYILSPTSSDFRTVCDLAGLDPEAVRDRLKPMIEAAPSPEELIGQPRTVTKRRAGVVSDFEGDQGTGGGRCAQDRPKMKFARIQRNARY